MNISPATAKPDPAKTFGVKDGILFVSGTPNGYLATEKEYADYTLKLQWRYPKGTAKPNSGILFHLGKDDNVWPHGYEAQLKAGFAGDLWLNPDSQGKYPSLEVEAERKDTANKEGRHYFRIGKDDAIEKELGEWNDFEIECQGDAMNIIVNGKQANEAKKSSLKKGRIALQSEGSEVQFRNLEIRTGK